MQELVRLAGGDFASRRQEGHSAQSAALSRLSRDPSLPTSSRNELNSLAAESDPELLAEGLYHWARREEEAERLGGAVRAYEMLNAGHPGLEIGEGLRSRVARRLAVLSGGGQFGDRVEHLSRRFFREASNPVAIAGMAAGSLVFSSARAAILARFATAGRPIFAARALASSGAFLSEVPAFWATTKGLNEVFHPGSQSWEMSQNLRELGGLALTLGALKLSAAAVNGGVAWAHRPNGLGQATRLGGWTAVTQRLAPQVGMLGGIMVGHHLEVALGLRPAVDAGSAWTDGLATLLQFNVGGRLSQSLLGRNFQSYSAELELRSRSLEAQARRPLLGGSSGLGPNLGFPPLAMAMADGPGLAEPALAVGGVRGLDLRPIQSIGAGSGEAAPRLIPRSGRNADDRFERPMPADEILQALQGREVLREIENHLEYDDGRETVSETELGSAVGEALSRRIGQIMAHPDYEPVRALTADRWRLDYSILPSWENLRPEFRESLDAAAELMQVTQFALRSNQSELSSAVQAHFTAEHQRVYRELVDLIPILRGPRFTLPRGDIARGSEVIQAEEAVLSHGTGDMSSLLKAVMRQSRPGGRPWYARYFATDADARIVDGIRREGRNPNFTKPVRHNYEHDIPMEPVHNRDPLATALFRRVRVQFLNVPSTVLDRFLSEEYVRNLPEGAILVSAIGGLLNGGIERPRLPYQFIRERLNRYGRDDVEVVSMAGYIPGDKLWRGEHVEVNLSTREDTVKPSNPRAAAPLVARLLSGAPGPNTYSGDYLSATVSHWDHSNNLGKVAKNVFTLMVGYEAGRIARDVVQQQSQVERNHPRWNEIFEIGHSRYAKARGEVWNMMQGLLVTNEGIKPLRARYNAAVYNDFDSCSKIEFDNLVEVARRAEALQIDGAAPGDIHKFLQDHVFSPERHVASTRNPRRGIAHALYEGWFTRGLPFTYEEVGPKVTTEGVDSLGPLLRYYDDPSLGIERRRLPNAVYDLHQAFLGRAVQPPPRIGDYLRMAIEDKPEDVRVIDLQKGLQEIGLPASRLRPLLEGSSQDALRILNHEIRRLAILSHLEARSPEEGKGARQEEIARQGELLKGLEEAMLKGDPVRVIRSPIHLGPYENAFIIQRQDPSGLTHQAFLRIRLEAIYDRMTSLGMFLRSFPPQENVDVQVRIPNASSRVTNFKQLYELQMITQEITEAFRRHRSGSVQFSLDRRPNDEKLAPPVPPAPEFYEALLPLAQWVQGGNPGTEEVRALFRRSRHDTSQAIDEVLRSGNGWPMLMGPAAGPIQSGIRALATRPEKATLVGVYAGQELVDTFGVYRYSATEPRILSHSLMRRFAEALPHRPEYRSLTAQDYFRGMTVDSFLRDYREYAELQKYGPLQVRTLPITYAPVEHAIVGNIPELNAGLLKIFLTEGSPRSVQLLQEAAPLYELRPEESRRRFIELAQPYLEEYLGQNEAKVRKNPVFDLFRRFGLLRRRPR